MDPYTYLGLDGGGTKTASVILNAKAEEIGRGRGGPCNIATCSDDQICASISEATETALSEAGLHRNTRFAGVCAGVAGYTAKGRRSEFRRLLEERVSGERHQVEPDFVIAYWGATKGEPGIIVSAGTGAVVYGRNAAGVECRADGRGFLYGDRGSAFDVARSALKRIIDRLDEGGELTSFEEQIMERIGARDADDIVEWTYRDFSTARIASVGEVVTERARAGDAEARALLDTAGEALRESLDRVVRRLALPPDCPVYKLGAMWHGGNPIENGFTHREIKSVSLPLSLREPLHDPAFGAALLAMRIPA